MKDVPAPGPPWWVAAGLHFAWGLLGPVVAGPQRAVKLSVPGLGTVRLGGPGVARSICARSSDESGVPAGGAADQACTILLRIA